MQFTVWRNYGYEGMRGDRFDTLAEAQAEYDRVMAFPEKRRGSFGTPEIMLHPVPQCSECAHWTQITEPSTDPLPFGVCELIQIIRHPRNVRQGAMAIVEPTPATDNNYLVTAPDFGCLQFDPLTP